MKRLFLFVTLTAALVAALTGCGTTGGAVSNRLPEVTLHGADRIAKSRPPKNIFAAIESDFSLAGNIETQAKASATAEETYISLLTQALKQNRFRMADSATVRKSNGTTLRIGPF